MTGNLDLRPQRHRLSTMTDTEIKAFITEEVKAQLLTMLTPLKESLDQLIRQREQQQRVDAGLWEKVQEQLKEAFEAQAATILQLAEINRALGIDSAEAELDPNYRN
jgi:hypothetical protein